MTAVDTNIVIRLLTRDDKAQYEKAYRIFSEEDYIFISATVFLEAEWVLRHAYGLEAARIVDTLTGLLELPNVHTEDPVKISSALGWHSGGLDFADALHLANSQNCGKFMTFDKAFFKEANGLGGCLVELA